MSNILISVDGIAFTKANGKVHKKMYGKVAILRIVDDKEVIEHATMLIPVQSSNVTHVGFIDNADHGILVILFSNGGLYFYKTPTGIIAGLYMQTVNSASIGKHVNAKVKNVHPYEAMGKV